MSVFYKKLLRKDPRDKSKPGKFHPTLVTMGQKVDIYKVTHEMQKTSSLSQGEIENVINNFVEVMRATLYNGHSVHIRDFGVFSLSARTVGTEKVEDCTVQNIRAIRINFRPSVNVKPILNATTRTPGEKIDFMDIEKYQKPDEEETKPDEEETKPDGEETKPDEEDDPIVDPSL